jgi:hypothetical protein
MYARPLDTPPPPSQFRRPWSPDPYDPLPSTSAPPLTYYNPFPREPSDVSVEALDLAAYQSTLRPHPYPDYPPRPTSIHPPASRESFPSPSLVSDRYTSSSTSHSRNSPAYTSTRTPTRRPFSLPPPTLRSTSPLNRSAHNYPSPHIAAADPAVPSEIDISQFPRFSRHWYTNPKPPSPDYDSPTEHYFDPNYHQPYQPYPYSPPSTESGRGLLPWTIDPPDYARPVSDHIKEERMRMLQREFGGNAIDAGHEAPSIGGVDQTGHLITQGPKKRKAVRVAQVLLVLGAGVPSIYGALVHTCLPCHIHILM